MAAKVSANVGVSLVIFGKPGSPSGQGTGCPI